MIYVEEADCPRLATKLLEVDRVDKHDNKKQEVNATTINHVHTKIGAASFASSGRMSIAARFGAGTKTSKWAEKQLLDLQEAQGWLEQEYAAAKARSQVKPFLAQDPSASAGSGQIGAVADRSVLSAGAAAASSGAVANVEPNDAKKPLRSLKTMFQTVAGLQTPIGCLQLVMTSDNFATGITTNYRGETEATQQRHIDIAVGNMAMGRCGLNAFRQDMRSFASRAFDFAQNKWQMAKGAQPKKGSGVRRGLGLGTAVAAVALMGVWGGI